MKKHVFVATPSHSGKVTVNYVQSIVDLAVILMKNKIPLTRSYIVGNAFIVDARNRCLADFLDSPATDLLFIDDDIGFDAYGAYRLIQSKEDMIGGAYPQKKDELIFNVGLKPGCVQKGRLFEVDFLGAGLLKISRRAVESMIERWPDRKYAHTDGRVIPNLFGDAGGSRGEDVTFMRRWQECGGQVWCDPDIDFVHTGTKEYSGRFSDILDKARAA